jgi:hypothetical protein
MLANMHWSVVVMSCLALGADDPVSKQRAAPVAESAPVDKDNVAVTVVLERASFSADAQPIFKLRFQNVGDEYRNLYNVAAYWNWTVVLTRSEPDALEKGEWRLKMNSRPHGRPIEHRQIKAGESTEVLVDLNEPPFTFAYVPTEPTDDKQPRPVKHLPPGRYKLTATVSLTHPFGEGYKQWTGPVTTKPVELTITAAARHKDTPAERAAYAAAIARVTDQLRPDGLWMNGISPRISAARDSKLEDVIDEIVNQSTFESKAYRVLRVEPFERDEAPGPVTGSAALLRVNNSYKVLVFFPFQTEGWWSRFYDTDFKPNGSIKSVEEVEPD